MPSNPLATDCNTWIGELPRNPRRMNAAVMSSAPPIKPPQKIGGKFFEVWGNARVEDVASMKPSYGFDAGSYCIEQYLLVFKFFVTTGGSESTRVMSRGTCG